ncbi:HlyC/CorC family transporter [Candidatus Woesearchaeota archaeon]|nr:HlyC/CorC family transporter [Candidatus Woesearchaeota archaeon]
MVLFNYLIITFLIGLSALFSGLSLGLMSLGPYALQRKIKLGNKNAQKVYPLRKRGNQLLCTLLLGNVAVNSALAVFLGSLTQGIIASLTATGLIVIFGEILPQAIFSRHALEFGARFAWLVSFFFYLFYPVTWPIAYGLDRMLGKELPAVFTKKEFSLFIEQQKKFQKSDIREQEFSLLQRGLHFSDKNVGQVMTPWKNTYHLRPSMRLTPSLRVEIQLQGCSRIPVYDPHEKKVVGIFFTKDLVSKEYLLPLTVREIMRPIIFYIQEADKLDKVLNLFKKNRVHIFIVLNKSDKIVGIITLEDVLEEIVGEILDEHEDEDEIQKAAIQSQ